MDWPMLTLEAGHQSLVLSDKSVAEGLYLLWIRCPVLKTKWDQSDIILTQLVTQGGWTPGLAWGRGN